MFSGRPWFFFNHSKDISEFTILNPSFSNPNFLTIFDFPLPAPPAKNTTFLFGLGFPSILGIVALTPDLVLAKVSSKSKVDIPFDSPALLKNIISWTSLFITCCLDIFSFNIFPTLTNVSVCPIINPLSLGSMLLIGTNLLSPKVLAL